MRKRSKNSVRTMSMMMSANNSASTHSRTGPFLGPFFRFASFSRSIRVSFFRARALRAFLFELLRADLTNFLQVGWPQRSISGLGGARSRLGRERSDAHMSELQSRGQLV